MSTNITNASRALELASTRCETLGDFVDMIERALDEAEDRGGERASLVPEADALTVAALKDMVREMLEPLRPTVSGADLNHRTANVVQVIVSNFRIRLMDESDDVTDPVRGPAK